MSDVRGMFDSEYIGAWDLSGKDVVVTIDRAEAGELTGQGGKKSKKPILYFQGKKKGMALNKTNMKIVAGLYGYDTRAWRGKQVVLYPTKTAFGAQQDIDCIRIRQQAPRGVAQPIEREPGDDSDQESSDAEA